MDEPFLLECYELLKKTLRRSGQRLGLAPDELDDVLNDITLKLLRDDQTSLRLCKEADSIDSYLAVLARNYILDRMIGLIGKWRPCAAARKLGPPAPQLDRLLNLESLPFDEAEQVLRSRFKVTATREELLEMARQFPRRDKRQFVGWQDLPEPVTVEPDPEQQALLKEEQAQRAKLYEAVEQALNRFEAEDRLILKLLYRDGRKVSEVARMLGLDQKRLYDRRDALLKQLRQYLKELGFDLGDIE